jgi:hypothetical protein
MPITIFGSWRDTDTKEFTLYGSRGEFKEACEALGRALASAEQQVIVNSDSTDTADYHVVEGIVNRAGDDETLHPLIHVVRPRTAPIFSERSREHGRLFTSHRSAQSREGARIISVQDADAVLTIGGGSATYRAGLAALVAGKTLVPIASFGGASAWLLDALEQFGKVRNIKEFGPLGNTWAPPVLDTALRLAGVTRPPRLLIIHGRSDDRYRLVNWISRELEGSIGDLVVMFDEFGVGKTMPQKFEDLASEVDAAIAIATPDDVGGLATESPEDYEPRARENVWLEVGWFWGRLGSDKVMILRKGNTKIPSDLEGLEIYPYDTDPSQVGDKIRKFINTIQHS